MADDQGRVLSPEEFTAVRDSVIADAPDGLSEQDFGRWLAPRLEQALAQVEFGGQKIPTGAGLSKVGQDTREFLGGLGESLNPITMIKGLGQAVSDPWGTAKNVYENQVDTFARGAGDFGQGRYSEGAGKMLGGLIPIVGPAAAKAGERIGSGDVAGGLGEATGLVGSVLGPGMVNKAAAPVRQAAQRGMRSAAERAMGAAVKPDRSYLEKMSGASREGIAGMERRVLGTILDEDIGPTNAGLDRAQRLIDTTDATRTAKIASAPQDPIRGAGHGADNAVLSELRKVAKGTAPQRNVKQVQNLRDKMRTDPRGSEEFLQRVDFPEVPTTDAAGFVTGTTTRAVPGKGLRRVKDQTPLELAETVTADNATLRGLFGRKGKDAEAAARMAVRNRNAKSLDKVAGTKGESRRMRDLIDARNVLNVAHRRVAATNPISLTDFLALSSGSPVAMVGSLGVKAPVLSKIAQVLNKGGKKVGAKHNPSKLLRALLQGQNLHENEDE